MGAASGPAARVAQEAVTGAVGSLAAASGPTAFAAAQAVKGAAGGLAAASGSTKEVVERVAQEVFEGHFDALPVDQTPAALLAVAGAAVAAVVAARATLKARRNKAEAAQAAEQARADASAAASVQVKAAERLIRARGRWKEAQKKVRQANKEKRNRAKESEKKTEEKQKMELRRKGGCDTGQTGTMKERMMETTVEKRVGKKRERAGKQKKMIEGCGVSVVWVWTQVGAPCVQSGLPIAWVVVGDQIQGTMN